MSRPLRIDFAGGGPDGLYCALLMKKADPRHRVRVIERNRAGDTFGFGVVFSDQTMAGLAEADETLRSCRASICRGPTRTNPWSATSRASSSASPATND